MKLETLESKVKTILEENETARADDMALYADYAYREVEGLGLGIGWLVKVFSDRRFRVRNGIAGVESVTRVRRRLQEKYSELRPDKETLTLRKEEEKRYKAYARGKKC